MILLDTDHVSVLQYPASERRDRLVARMALAVGEDFGVPIVVVEEQTRPTRQFVHKLSGEIPPGSAIYNAITPM